MRDHKGNEYESVDAMCAAYGVSREVYDYRMKRGHRLSDILNDTGHITVSEICRAYGITRTEYHKAVENGIPLFMAKDIGNLNCAKIEDRTDHLGNVYSSLREMLEHYGIGQSAYYSRLRRGVSKSEALTAPVKEISSGAETEKRTDHLGNVYKTIKDMCAAYGISYDTYRKRLEFGHNKEKALTLSCKNEKITDHKGTEYSSIDDMCRNYGVSSETYRRRLMYGEGKEEALTSCIKSTSRVDIQRRTDHLGNVYPSIKDMCNAYNVSVYVYNKRIKRGMTKEQALDSKTVRRKQETRHSREALKRGFSSVNKMCAAYGISANTYYKRLGQGYTVDEVLSKYAEHMEEGMKFSDSDAEEIIKGDRVYGVE